jgi:hypothetical protein
LKFKFRKYENGKWSFEFKNTHTAPKKILWECGCMTNVSNSSDYSHLKTYNVKTDLSHGTEKVETDFLNWTETDILVS